MLVKILALIAKGLAKTNGKKSVTGALTTLTGFGMLFIPGLEGEGVSALVVGIPLLITGITHKIVKKGRNNGHG